MARQSATGKHETKDHGNLRENVAKSRRLRLHPSRSEARIWFRQKRKSRSSGFYRTRRVQTLAENRLCSREDTGELRQAANQRLARQSWLQGYVGQSKKGRPTHTPASGSSI